MKKTIALITALILTLGVYGTVFAQAVSSGVGYDVVINGQSVVFADEDAINVDGVSMFTENAFVSKFTDTGLTAESVKKSQPFSFLGKDYYALRDVAAANSLNVYWDGATRTALVINKANYDKIKELIDISNKNQTDATKFEFEFDGDVKILMDASGMAQTFELPISGSMKMDLEKKFFEYGVKTSLFGTEMNVQVYDDGEFTYTNSGDESWFKTESQLASSAEMIDQLKDMNPTTTAQAEELSIAGLKISESGGVYTLEGNMYTSESFNGIDYDEIMEEAYSSAGLDIDVNMSFDWPEKVYVKYVMQGDGTIDFMSLKFNMGLSVNAEGEQTDIAIEIDFDIPKLTINGDFETVVPKEVLDAADDFALPEQQ